MIRRTLPLAATLAVLAACGDTDIPTAVEREPLRVNATAGSLGYVAIDLGAGPASEALAINDAGQVLVRSVATRLTEYYLWEDGALLPITVNGEDAAGIGLNEAGQVFGVQFTSSGQQAILWEKAGGSVLPSTGTVSVAQDANDSGVVVGVSFSPPSANFEAMLWTGGVPSTLAVPPAAGSTFSLRINNAGQIVVTGSGSNITSSYFLDSGVMSLLPGLPADLNDAGAVVGQLPADPSTGQRNGFFWQGGTTTPIGAPDGEAVQPVEVNEAGQVLVRAFTTGSYFLWEAGSFTPIQTGRGLLSPGRRLNDSGQVALFGPLGVPLIWENGNTTQLPLLSSDPFAYAEPVWINNHGHVVGRALAPADAQNPVPTDRAVLWRPISAVEAIEAPKSAIEDAVATGDIDSGNGNALTSKLNTATALLNDGKPGPAINKLEATINQLNAMMPNKLDPAIGQPLVDQIQALIDALS